MIDNNNKMEKSNANYSENPLISAVIKEETQPSEDFKEFVEQFYISLSEDYVEQAGMLLCIARDIYKILQKKDKGLAKIRIFNPTVKDDGWQSGFTVIEVLNDDMPFLVDSFTEEIKSNGYSIHQRINSVLGVQRDKNGNLEKVYNINEKEGKTNESLIYFAINKINKSAIDKLKNNLIKVLALIHAVFNDWQRMLSEVDLAIKNLDYSKLENGDVDEIKIFLEWLKKNNFVFLGYAEYNWKNKKLEKNEKSLLGISRVNEELHETAVFNDEHKYPIYITRSDNISKVHRRVNMDCIRLKIFDESGKILGERIFLGLFTSIVYYQDVRLIPIVRKKLEKIEQLTKFAKGGHNNKALITIMQGFPRAELLHISIEDLYKTCIGMLSLSIKPRFKLFIHRDRVGMFIRLIIFIPNEQFSMKLWKIMQEDLVGIFNGTVLNEYIVIVDSGLVRLQLILKVKSMDDSISDSELEKTLELMARDWDSNLKDILNEKIGTTEAQKLYDFYSGAFPESYKEIFDTNDVYSDIKKLEIIRDSHGIETDLYMVDDNYHLKVYVYQNKLHLYDLIPVIDKLSLRVIDHYSYKIKKSPSMWIHHFILIPTENIVFPLEKFKDQFEMVMIKILKNEVENDYYNSLIILAGLTWREVLLIRTFGHYLKQICFKYSPEYIQSSLAKHPEACTLIIKLFHARFNKNTNDDKDPDEKIEILKHKIENILANIKNLIEDRIIRIFVEICFAIVRTNYYLEKDYVSIKIRSDLISDMPLPKPFVEIFVYSNKFEAIHLRGGEVSRGGIRWSDRTEDFRTEVLGLMKAQMHKNVTIVPVGSKGGFITKDNFQDKKLNYDNAVRCYQDFLRGMLDITDNIISGQTIQPHGIICYDTDDPYLVVAADKGTATFSNYANAVSKEYNFWLSDAFASGGSSGYDHKKLAITSRGAWVSLELRFWEKFGSLTKEPFTAVGIGDMSGDLFGNGMLLSNKIKLIGAFNHMHIFIDPNPDIEISFKERERLFKMTSSTWLDYNPDSISSGGGIFLRSSKSIEVTSEMKKVFNIHEEKLSPNDLIKYILKANVDIIWNGGIGTYVKSSNESNESVGDKENDAVRVDGKDVRAKIIVEGGNLGCTQLGRIEYSENGGCINTDSIDNCAGVCCSDMEVNIKIAFASAIEKKKLTLEKRDQILLQMQGEVTEIILNRTNKLQSLFLMIENIKSKKQLEQYQILLNKLESSGLLNRKVEFLPTDEQIKRMFAEGTSFARPQIAVLAAYAKMNLYNRFLSSDLPDNHFLTKYLIGYFPSIMREKYSEEILAHPLKREIIATYITNTIINRIGCTFINNAVENTGFSTKEIMSIIISIYEIYKLNSFFKEIDSLVGKINIKVFEEINIEFMKFVNRTVYWFLRNYPQPIKIGLAIDEFMHEVDTINQSLINILDSESLSIYNSTLKRFIKNGVPEDIAKKIASLQFLGSALSIVQTANNLRFYAKMQITSLTTGSLYFKVGSLFYFAVLRRMATDKFESSSYWQRISTKTLSDELYDKQTLFTSEIAKYFEEGEEYTKAIFLWKEKNSSKLKRYEAFFNELRASGDFDVSKFVMLTKRLGTIIIN